MLARQSFITYLSNAHIHPPIESVFPGIRPSDELYQKAKKKVMGFYKTWKNWVIKAAETFINNFIDADGQKLASARTFKRLKAKLHEAYQPHWLESLFKFTSPAIDFDDVSDQGHVFLKCMTISSCV